MKKKNAKKKTVDHSLSKKPKGNKASNLAVVDAPMETSSKATTQLVEADVSDLIHADWNYKTDGTPEQIEKLMNAITEAGSCGVLAVREVKVGKEFKLEVMDGNHRLTAIQNLGWKKVPIENFGRISKAKAVILTRQRNQNWFDDDRLKLANLFAIDVFPEFSMEHLSNILPETMESLESLKGLASVDWATPGSGDGDGGGSSNDYDPTVKKIFLRVPEETFNLWSKWLERCKDITGLGTPERAFEFAVIEALNVPEESLGAKK